MSDASDNVSDLFGESLAAAAPAAGPAPFQDGLYRLRGLSMKKGIYKSGKWSGKPYARFVFELVDVPGGRQVSQMLPWFPGKAFFEINFQRLCGLRLSEFTEQCRREGLNDASAQSRFFLSLFRGVEFRAEVRQRGEWLNVWELKERLGFPDQQAADAVGTAAVEQQAQALMEPAAPEPAVSHSLAERIGVMARQLGLDDAALAALCQEEFGVAPDALDDVGRRTLLELLAERGRRGVDG